MTFQFAVREKLTIQSSFDVRAHNSHRLPLIIPT
jgi:hypothetical protein